jgi:hypothetical protein
VEPAVSRSASLVRFADPETCQAALEIPDLAAHLEGRLGEHVVVVKQGELAQFKKKLKQHGIGVEAGDAIVDDPARKPAEPPAPEKARKESHKDKDKEEPAVEKANGSENGNGTNGDAHIKLPSYSPRIIREIIEDAIARRKPILIEYEPTYGTHATVRRVNPVALDLAGSAPSLSGYCHVHGGPRAFKLSRINGVRVLEEESF